MLNTIMIKNNLTEFWEKKVIKSDKHFVETLSEEKIERMTQRVDEFILSNLDFSKIKTTLDWGCGGGLFAKILLEKSNVILADISEESILEAKKHTGKNHQSILIPQEIDNFNYQGGKVDLLFCHTVIHHFPSYEYWCKVFDIWTKKIKPEYFGLQIKIGDETTVRNDYFKDENYLNALYLEETEFVNKFRDAGYKKINLGYKINRYKNSDKIMKVGYFVFQKYNY